MGLFVGVIRLVVAPRCAHGSESIDRATVLLAERSVSASRTGVAGPARTGPPAFDRIVDRIFVMQLNDRVFVLNHD